MNDNSTLRYLSEAYDGVCFHVEPMLSALVSDAAMRAYLMAAAAAFAVYSAFFIFGSIRDIAGAMRTAFRRA
ncbi:hypothetical protein [Parvibaculum sp.]|jgi:hypothetical protein|uniref:hypothetical protein n=1 Tax=Parvibaculum sp. TaxID=2024848 RepID=UPI002FD8C2EA